MNIDIMTTLAILLTECDGSLTLLSENEPEKVVELGVRPIHFEGRKRRKIKRFHEDTKQLIRFEKATMIGNCCWKVWNKYRSGESFPLIDTGTFEPGWAIRAVELLDSCNID